MQEVELTYFDELELKGVLKGKRETLLRLLAAKFGPLPDDTVTKIAAIGSAAELDTYLERCHSEGQARPTPLMLKYGAGDYNCLHQDLYGDMVFPLQATFLLSAPRDFDGGEFVMTEQRPRMQSRAEVVRLDQGEAVIFAVNRRPMQGARGIYRVAMRHGVSRIRAGARFTLGIIFHDAA